MPSSPPGTPTPTCSSASPSTRASASRLLEAMRAGLPIVAFAAGAVPETLGGAGLALESKRPGTVAAAIDRVRQDGRLADELTAAGHRRLRRFLPGTTRARFVDALRPLVAPGLAKVGG